MSTRCSVFIACSLDGYIAKSDGSIDWLTTLAATLAGEDYGYKEFMATVDAVVLGRATYELVMTYAEWPYGKRMVFVLSRNYPAEGKQLGKSTIGTSAAPKVLVSQMSKNGAHRAYVDGGKTIQSFLRNGLIDDLTITRIPILLGDGLPLFGTLESELRIRHTETRSFPNGFVQSKYEMKSGV